MGTLCNRLMVLPLYRNARFWVWQNSGWVKLTLRPGESLTTGWWQQQTNEGWHQWVVTWTYDGLVVRRISADESRGCDGRLDRYGEDECAQGRLHSWESCYREEGDPDGLPDWQKVESGQRDYSAEAMGY